jgi:hypothetical protein
MLLVLLADAGRPDEGNDDLAEYEHRWSEDALRSGLGWLERLLELLFKDDLAGPLLRWLTERIGGIRPERDGYGKIGSLVAWWVKDASAREGLGPWVDLALASLRLELRRGSVTASVTRLLEAGHRTDDCYQLLEESITRSADPAAETLEAAVACGMARPGSERRYLERLGPDARILAEERIADHRGVPALERIAKLLTIAETSAARSQLEGAVSDALTRLADHDGDLRALAQALHRLLPRDRNLESRLARKLCELLQPAERERMRQYLTLFEHAV